MRSNRVLRPSCTSPGTGPGDYATTLDNGGARHMLPGDTWLGACVDSDGDGSLQDVGALADDLDAGIVQAGECEDGDDEDGITFSPILRKGVAASVTVQASAAGRLDAFIDYNADGDFTRQEMYGVSWLHQATLVSIDGSLDPETCSAWDIAANKVP